MGRLEAAVEDEYKTNLRYACNRERNYSEFQAKITSYPNSMPYLYFSNIKIRLAYHYRGVYANESSKFWQQRTVPEIAAD